MNKKSAALFEDARSAFESVVEELQGDKLAGASHAELEDLVVERGREIQRLLYQAHLRHRTVQEKKHESVIGVDGIERTHRRSRSRQLRTVVGPVDVERITYSSREISSLAPLDAELNLPEEMYSHGLRRLAAVEASRDSFEQSVEAIERGTGVCVPKRQVEELAQRASRDYEAFYEERKLDETPNDSLLVMSVDGKGIVMRTESLTERTRRAAEAKPNKLSRRISKGEKANRKRMATVATIYDQARCPRTEEQVMGVLNHDEVSQISMPRPRNKRVWARIDKSVHEVITSLFDEAEKRDPDRTRQWVVLVDGAKQQLLEIQREARQRGVEITVVVDFIHVLEYLWRAAWCFFEEGDVKAEDWVIERALQVLRGKASDVAAGIRRSATKRKLAKNNRRWADRCSDYLLNKKKFLEFDSALQDGLPIATGVIEGACRHLVSDRMDITGARWSLKGAEAILRLRSLRSSNDFDDYWSFHLRAEHVRVHLSRLPNAA